MFYTYDAWVDTFKPIKNTVVPHRDIEFETYGAELDFVINTDNHNVWTEVDGMEGTYIINGYHLVNRIQYYITENPWTAEYIEVPTAVWKEVERDKCSDEWCECCVDRDDYRTVSVPCETVEDLKVIYGEDSEIVG